MKYTTAHIGVYCGLAWMTVKRAANWQRQRIPGACLAGAACYAPAMDPLHATIEEFAADGYTHVSVLPALRVTRLRPMGWLSFAALLAECD